MKILSRPGIPNKTQIPAPFKVRHAAAEIIGTGRYDEEELEDALVLVGGYFWGLWRTWRGNEGRGEEVIGRQVPAGDAGTLDLITLHWPSGELIIYELKAREIQVGDLAQVENYRVALNELDLDDLAWLLVIHSGRKGVPRIWNAKKLRKMLGLRDDAVSHNEGRLQWSPSDYNPYLLRIGCAVVGRAWEKPVARLANSMGIELIHIPELVATVLDEIAKEEMSAASEEG